MRLLRKNALRMKLLLSTALNINTCRESLYVINVAFGYEKKIIKNNLALILSEKKFSAWTKISSPPPPPEYQMDRA